MEVVRGGFDRIADLEPLYRELHDHHVTVLPRLAGLAARTATESWTRRRARYEAWLSGPDAFVLVAEQRESPIGFVVVTMAPGYQAWASQDRVGEVRDLVVAATSRAQGVGTALMDAVESHLVRLGIREYRVTAISANENALRFYASRGMTPVAQTLLGRVDAD